MKIDKSRIKKSTSEVPAECQALIDRLRSCNEKELLKELRSIETWTYGKCELYHWIDILDLCDKILETATLRVNPKSWQLNCDLPHAESKELLLWVLHFTTLLIEHSFSRHLYNSVEHLLTLMSSCDLHVVLGVLNLLYMFSKRSNFLTRLLPEMRAALLTCLTYLAESWGGKEHGFGLADCCRDNLNFSPQSATTLHYEFYSEEQSKGSSSQVSCIHLENVDKLGKSPYEIMDSLIEAFNVPKDGQMLLFTHVRLAYSFSDYKLRLKCVQARLQALSVLLYSNTFSDSNSLLYQGILNELVELLQLKDPELDEIHSAALRTLTSIIHLDRSPHMPKKPISRLTMIIDVTGAGLYHGFLPQLVRNCISSLTGQEVSNYPLPLATALFSFLYHLASYEAGGEALVSCGMMECLLRVINWNGTELEHITFVTRAVRVIDLITNIDMQGFQSHNGLTSFTHRLEMEINICRTEQPFVIYIPSTGTEKQTSQTESDAVEPPAENEVMQISIESEPIPCCSKDATADTHMQPTESTEKTKTSCLPQRAALLKSMLNFLKKAIQDPAFSESIRHVMDSSLPATLKHIVSNPDYYGPSLFLLATDVVAVYVFQEPSLLSSLQDNGLTDVVLHALLVKNVPATREVLGSLPNVFSALCLNARGLASFTRYSPFERLFRVLHSPIYLSAMRRRRSSDPIGDTATNLGSAMDELMRHQPVLKTPAITAIVELLKTLCQLGRDANYVCWRPQKGSIADSAQSSLRASRGSNEGGSSDEDDDDEEEASTSSHPQREDATTVDPTATTCHEKTPIALVDYILNVMKFVDAILSNNSTDDHCREFVTQGGLEPLLSILGLPNLPVDYPITPAAQSVASVCKSILNLAHEPQVMKEGLTQLQQVLEQLKPLYSKKKKHKHTTSILLHELAQSPSLETAFTTPSATPLLHAMSAAHGFVVMFVHVCRTGQLDIRTISMTQWGSDLGLHVLDLLSQLYTALVWESTILLTLCCQDTTLGIRREDMEKLCPFEKGLAEMDILSRELSTSTESIADGSPPTPPSLKFGRRAVPSCAQIKYIKPLLGVSSRLGRALAELFGLLVKLCVGFPVRTRRGNHLTSTPVSPTPSAQAVATSLATLLARGLNCEELPYSPMPRFKLTYLICAVGFTSPMLFDEKKYPYHLMLQKFVNLKGQSAFFSAFRWALSGGDKFPLKVGLEHPDLPETTGEFLDAWLLLLEKLVNPKAILESTHMLPTKPNSNCKVFDPIKYLQEIHKVAFIHVSYLWGKKPLKTYGGRMTETMLTIFRHILRGEKIVEERKSKDSDSSSSNQSSTTSELRRVNSSHQVTRPPEVNMNALTQLMDMGFSRENCYEALMLTTTLEHATDYLLSNFFPTRGQIQEEIEQEEDFEPLTRQVLDEFTTVALSVCLDLLQILPDTVYRVCDLLNTIMRRNGERFTYEMLNSLADGINEKVKYMLNYIDSGRSAAEIAAELVTSAEAQQAAAVIHLYMLLFEEVRVPCANIVHSSGMLPLLLRLITEGTDILAECPTVGTPKWMAPLLLLIDLLEKVSCVTNRKCDMHNVTSCVWRWFDLTTGKWCLYMPHNNKLINESYWRGDKILRISSGRRRYSIIFEQMVQTNEDSGKQRPIMMTLKHPLLTEVEDLGNPSTSGGNVYDSSSSQSNSVPPRYTTEDDTPPRYTTEDDTPPRYTGEDEYPSRFVLEFDGPTNPTLNAANTSSGVATSALVSNISQISTIRGFDRTTTYSTENEETDTDFFHRRTGMQGVDGLHPEGASNIVGVCVKMMSIPVDPDTLHAAMQVCVRFTRNFENARIIADMGIVSILLSLTQASSFVGFTGLATILIRHILEEPSTLHLAMEKMIRAKVLPNIPPSYKELHYVLRECSSAICRDSEIFKAVAKQIMRVDTSVLNKRSEDEDIRLLMKALLPTQATKTKSVDGIAQKTICDLLNALVIVLQDEVDATTNSNAPDQSQAMDDQASTTNNNSNIETAARPSTSRQSCARQQNRLASDVPNLFPDNATSQLRNVDTETDAETFSPLNLPMYMAATSPNQPSVVSRFVNNIAEGAQEKKKCMLSKSSILKILGDAVRSFPTIARIITEHRYFANQSDYIKEDCTAIAFLLEHQMIARDDNLADLDRPNTTRMLIAALASCNHSQEAQSTLVTEVKAALARTLAWPESAKKHTHIQDLVAIITIMIDHCPPVPISTAPLSPSLKINQISVNNIIRFLVRKGIIADLAHVPHHLDLSSPKMPLTMNAVLKPLEVLSRVVSQPSGSSPSKSKPKPPIPAPSSDEIANMQTETNTSDAIHVEGDDIAEDTDNTDHDVSGAVEISSDVVNPGEDGDECTLARVREMIPISPDTSRRSRMDFATLSSRFQQTLDNSQPSPGSSSDDSDSNSSNEGRNNMDGNATDIDLQEDDDTHHGNENGEETGGGFEEERVELYASDAGLLRIPLLDRDSDDFLMIEYAEPDTGSGVGPWSSNTNFPLPFSLFEDPSNLSGDNSALNRIPSHHPLLMTRQNMESSNMGVRSQRLNRPRRYQYLHMNRSSGAPIFLQRLTSDQSFLPPSNSASADAISSAFGTRVIVMDNGLGILTNAEEEQINFVDQSGYLLGPSLAATLNNVPTSMHWWNEESRLLDAESQADAAVVLGYELVPYFEKIRNDEIFEMKEKRKKQEEEEYKKSCPGTSNGTDSEKKKFYPEGIGSLEPPQSRPPTRPSPNRRMAMLAAAQEVAQATENLAGSIVESVLHPRNTPIQPPIRTFHRTSFHFSAGPASPQSDPPESSGENVSNDIMMHISEPNETHNIPAALELIPVASTGTNLSSSELSDPLGLIPGSVPFPPPSDPDDGFFRVNPPPLAAFCDDSPSVASPPPENMFLPCSEPPVPNLFSSLELDNWSGHRIEEVGYSNSDPEFINNAQPTDSPSGFLERDPSEYEDMFPSEEEQEQEENQRPFEAELTRSNDIFDQSPQPTVSSQEFISASQISTPATIANPHAGERTSGGGIRALVNAEERRRRRIRLVNMSRSRGQGPPVSGAHGSRILSSVGDSSGSSQEEVPEGVDPSFLAALPEEMRAEVISEHIRLQRLRQRVENQGSSDRPNPSSQQNVESSGSNEVNPDFLAALPLAIQEEVLAQQRLEQQRQAAALSNPNDPVDPAAFFQELPHSLRQSILTDMEDSQISVLPPELAAEAQNLRREWEARNRQLMQERFINHVTNNTSALSSILRTSGGRGIRRTNARYTIQNMAPTTRPHWMTNWAARFPVMQHSMGQSSEGTRSTSSVNTNAIRTRGRQVLDFESICCLLILLFVDDARLNTVRLHRLFRFVCCHAPTRDWVIKALLSIMEKSDECHSGHSSVEATPFPTKRMKTRSQVHTDLSLTPLQLIANSSRTSTRQASSWLNISMDAALGCRATVFHVHKPPGRRSERTISINSQAAPFVYRHAIDILISLAKNFPMCFLPAKLVSTAPHGGSIPKASAKNRSESCNFWELLIRLDSISNSKKGKTTARISPPQASTSQEVDAFETSPFGQLLRMLGSPVVQSSPILTDRLLRLLSIISVGLYSKFRLTDKVEMTSIALNNIGLAINILTSHTCSEEGLEDCTGLLLNVTVNIPSTRDTVISLLLQGARNTASLVRQHIDNLLKELKVLNRLQAQNEDGDDQPVESKAAGMKGVLRSRFTKDVVVVTVPKKIKAGMDLQLSSMTPLISKTSSQAYLLRILKVIVQLRQSIRKYDKKKNTEQEGDTSSNQSGLSEPSQESSINTDRCSPGPTNRGAAHDESQIDNENNEGLGSASTSADKVDETQALPPLSEQLNLDELWDTLSACLTELAHTQDSHAVLVLQPAVEAFFMVHASGVENKPTSAENQNSQSLIRTTSSSTAATSSQQVPEELAAPAPPPVSPLPNDPSAESQNCTPTFPAWPVNESQPSQVTIPPHQQKFLKFAETHRTVLNQILRQCSTPLLEGPFAVLVNHTRVLDFDVKRRYFRGELERADEGHRREELAVHVRRTQVFEDSFRELHRRSPDEWKNRFYIVFEGEEGQDAGGLLREWYMIISREIFNPMYALFTTSPGDRVTYMINPSSHCNHNHLSYFKFVGRVIAKAIYDNKLLECYFTRSFYKHILSILVKYTDMESEDYSFYQGLVYLMENCVESLGYEVTFSTEVQEFGVTEIRDLIKNGRNLAVTEENKMDYIRLVCQMKMTGAIRKQLNSFLEGFYDIIPMRLISIFNEQELELLISGLPNVDIEDLKSNTEYYKYQPNSLQIQWFWRALREFDQAERAKFLQFVTGTSKVPLQGFTALEGMNGIQKFQIHRDERSTDRLPSAHTCFNQLDLPVYETYTKLRTYLLKAIHECSEGFGFA